MDKDKRPFVRRAEVLKKLNTENLQLIERGLLGDLPERFKPVPSRGQSTELAVTKTTSLLSSCLPIVPDSPPPYPEKRSPSIENLSSSPLKKSFSFRDRLRMGFFGKDKEKTKWKTISEEDGNLPASLPRPRLKRHVSSEQQSKSNKRFWFFRHKEFVEKRDKVHSPIYQRSKSFEFLPRLGNEDPDSLIKSTLTNSNSYAYGSSDTLASSNGSADYANVYYDKDNTICLKSIKPLQESDHNSSISTATSASSGIVLNIMKSDSIQDLLEEFDKAVDLFSENYLSDCETYTRTTSELTVKEKRKSLSFSTLPSPKILQMNKVDKVSDEFKDELTKILSVRQSSASARSPRRGSVTDWFVLEDKVAVANGKVMEISDRNRYRRAQNIPVKRVRRMSSTKYWITPEECEVYSRERRPPLVIPRITQYRAPRRSPRQTQIPYPEQEVCDVPAKAWQYSPTPDRSRIDLERSFAKANYDSPSIWSAKRLGGSTENLLGNIRRPTHLQLPASSSGDSLDVEIRERKPYHQERSRSMMAPKPKSRAPQPSPRLMDVRSEKKSRSEDPRVLERRYIKRTKYMEGGKKCKKNWVESYMTLTSTSIRFYKNENTYFATMRDPPSPSTSRPELVIMLHSAYVELSQHSQTRRHSRSLVLTQGNDQYLLQDESEESARNLLRKIQSIIGNLGPSYMMMEDRPSPVCSSGTDAESVGRTPPVSRHANKVKQKAGGSSVEDLSDSTEIVTKSDVRSKLKRFFARRPTMDVLVKNGIYKDEPVFGRKLEEVCPASSPRVPEFVKACIKEIESSEENMGTDGLYRASGNLSQVQKIRLEVDQNNFSVIENNTDIHVLTGSLKLFFRELKEPLIPFTLFDRVLAACSIKPREARIKEFREIIQLLPQCNRDTLKYLLEHLLRVTLYSERNRMHTANLAIVFGPTLLWAEKAENIAIDCIQQNNVVDILLNDFKEIFAEDTKVKKKA